MKRGRKEDRTKDRGAEDGGDTRRNAVDGALDPRPVAIAP